MSKYPYGGDRKAQNKDRTDHVLGYKSGGRVADAEGTKININIGAGGADKANAASAAMSAAAQAMKPPPSPPMMPPPGPPGGGPGGPPGLGGGPLGMKRGGRAKEESAAEEATETKAQERAEEKAGKSRHGGRITNAGAGSGVGRLQKA